MRVSDEIEDLEIENARFAFADVPAVTSVERSRGVKPIVRPRIGYLVGTFRVGGVSVRSEKTFDFIRATGGIRTTTQQIRSLRQTSTAGRLVGWPPRDDGRALRSAFEGVGYAGRKSPGGPIVSAY
jgi:hypothetical protein